jgi:aspartyl-tRNA(Asn)/glutamyl-tRNA(Gln) amidotransferase subunit A
VVDPAVQNAFQFALDQILPEKPSPMSLSFDCSRVRLAGFAHAVRDLIPNLVDLGPDRCAKFSDELVRMIEFGVGRDQADLDEDMVAIRKTRTELWTSLGNNGLLLLPTAPQTAFLHGDRAPNNMADLTALANIAGLPALTMPIARNGDGLPIGLQIIGPRGSEALIIAQARMINDRIKGYAPPADYW